MFYELKDVRESYLLKETYGEEVVLVAEGKESDVFRILNEFRLGDRIYAVLHSDKLAKGEDYLLYRVVYNGNEVILESIDDDEEWDAVAELYDEMTFTM